MNQESDNTQQVTFTFPDGSRYDGTVKKDIGANIVELTVDNMPVRSLDSIDRLEAAAKKEDDKYLFLDVYVRGSSSHTGRRSSSSTTLLSPRITLKTNEPANPLSLNVMSMGARIENLDLWLNKSLFTFRMPLHAHDTLEYSLHETFGDYHFKGFQLRFNLVIGGMHFSRFTRGVNLNQAAFVELSASSNTPYEELLGALRSLEHLLSLAFRSSIRAAELDVTSADYELRQEGLSGIYPAYSLTLSDIRPSTPDIELTEELGFTYTQISDLQELLNRWSELEDQFNPIVDLLMTSLSDDGVLENNFLNRVQALEAFHRGLRTGTRIPEVDYSTKKDEILSMLSGDNKKFVKGLLKRGNDLSLADRLKALNSELRARGLTITTVCNFDVIANTRNYLSHYSEDITDTCPNDQLGLLTYQLGQMLYSLIFVELGISDDITRRAATRLRR